MPADLYFDLKYFSSL